MCNGLTIGAKITPLHLRINMQTLKGAEAVNALFGTQHPIVTSLAALQTSTRAAVAAARGCDVEEVVIKQAQLVLQDDTYLWIDGCFRMSGEEGGMWEANYRLDNA